MKFRRAKRHNLYNESKELLICTFLSYFLYSFFACFLSQKNGGKNGITTEMRLSSGKSNLPQSKRLALKPLKKLLAFVAKIRRENSQVFRAISVFPLSLSLRQRVVFRRKSLEKFLFRVEKYLGKNFGLIFKSFYHFCRQTFINDGCWWIV